MTEPKLSWDEAANAGYIDLTPGVRDRTHGIRLLFEKGGVSFIIDRDAKGNISGIEVML